jgi:hypothetical protein
VRGHSGSITSDQMPVSVYFDGSGTHPGSELLTLTACGIADHLVDDLRDRWSAALRKHGVASLHMRTFSDLPVPVREPLLCDLLNCCAQLWSEFFYFRICSVLLGDYRQAKGAMPLLKSPEELCVDFCAGGLSVCDEDHGQENTVRLLFDRNERFRRIIHRVWINARRDRRSGWPRQVRAIESVSAADPLLQVADLFAWTVNRHLRLEDQPLLATSAIIGISHASLVYDLRTIRGLHDSFGSLLEKAAPGFEPTRFTFRFR